ncbi:MAG: protoporphyrinogen/coproporphyrinogen oxidase [Acidimicrobiales bacterium]
MRELAVIGAGVTGLAAGMASGAPVYEQSDGPGGICRSYYMVPGDHRRHAHAPADDDGYRFEVGGGHWIFGADPSMLLWLEQLAPHGRYERRAVVRFGELGITVPYPLQNHYHELGPAITEAVATDSLRETIPLARENTLHEWLELSFGKTLCDVFFFPFHDRYAAGLSDVVAAEDSYKSPAILVPGAPVPSGSPKKVGYNAEFSYPNGGLDGLVGAMAAGCDVSYNKKLTRIDCEDKRLEFADGTEESFGTVLSTLPLDEAVRLAGLEVDEPPDPSTSVLVLNIGAVRAELCPDAHWQYEPDSRSGFHRIGFYSNVDPSFLPASHRRRADKVSLYVERAFRTGAQMPPGEVSEYTTSVLGELRARRYIGDVDVVDPSFVHVAYTWRRPGSHWREQAIAALASKGVLQVGRYGSWQFQGIADSIRDGLAIGERAKRLLGARPKA